MEKKQLSYFIFPPLWSGPIPYDESHWASGRVCWFSEAKQHSGCMIKTHIHCSSTHAGSPTLFSAVVVSAVHPSHAVWPVTTLNLLHSVFQRNMKMFRSSSVFGRVLPLTHCILRVTGSTRLVFMLIISLAFKSWQNPYERLLYFSGCLLGLKGIIPHFGKYGCFLLDGKMFMSVCYRQQTGNRGEEWAWLYPKQAKHFSTSKSL